MKFIQEPLKLEGITQDFAIYPCKADSIKVSLQSATRFAEVDLLSGDALIVEAEFKSLYGEDLSSLRRTRNIKLGQAELGIVKEMRNRMAKGEVV